MTGNFRRRKKAKNVLKGLDPGYYLIHVDPKTLTDVTQLTTAEGSRIVIEHYGGRWRY